jgi:hypothetical protein
MIFYTLRALRESRVNTGVATRCCVHMTGWLGGLPFRACYAKDGALISPFAQAANGTPAMAQAIFPPDF